ncbi:anti-sigma factor [Burkholderia sp. Ac-20379]|uniref:anti-sigma factor n=1 Tax=Burkholderia sp. Ac-20379 TaxID=2703900 RepID=UPI001980E046|nr:anti-sigma factor [Burkholderia sp. Ac-20379]MBN3726545.1 anti-sigma factor [Burkholderia sp. Ac-20379]
MSVDDASLLAYVDGSLQAPEHDRIAAAIEQSEALARRAAQLRAGDLPYRDAFARQALPPVPASLVHTVDALIARHRAERGEVDAASAPAAGPAIASGNLHRLTPRRSWPTLAVAFVAGAFCCTLALRFAPGVSNRSAESVAQADTDGDARGMTPWIKAAADYQQLYTRDTVALLQPDMQAAAREVADINAVDKLPVRIPDLRDQGLAFKRVQRLRFHGKPLVQIVYLPMQGQGKPVALCVLHEAMADAAPSHGRADGLNVVSWRRGQLGYVLLGEAGAADLDALGARLYRGDASAMLVDDDSGEHGRRG